MEPSIKLESYGSRFLTKYSILGLACLLAFAIRLHMVINYHVIIAEYDPSFNYRATEQASEHGFYHFHNWYDTKAWYPMGRDVGKTVYNGLMATSGFIYWIMNLLHITVTIKEVCVFLSPLYAMFTVLATYGLTKECFNEGSGLLAGIFIGIAPGYISRSVAGSYDNECIAIFCMIFTYYLWIKAVKTGTTGWAVGAALAYFYMVASWGGYIYLINLIPLHVFVLMITGRFDSKAYVAYSVFYPIGILMSMLIPFVGFQPVSTAEHLGAFGVFGLCQLISFSQYLKAKLGDDTFLTIVKSLVGTIASVFCILLLTSTFLGNIAPFSGRIYSFLDPSHAKKNIPIIASVSEHQPTAWGSYYFDLHYLMALTPAGLYFCFKKLSNENIFIILYAASSIWFSGIMVRMMLVLTPIVCICSGIAISTTLLSYSAVKEDDKKEDKKDKKKKKDAYYSITSVFVIGFIFTFFLMFCFHSTWVTSNAYSSPSIVLAARSSHGTTLFDDFREAYYWLQMNTPKDSVVLSWWDYGYQIGAYANRTTLVDNNTANNTHISRVGQSLASNETHAIEIMREFNVDYVLIVFGGYSGYSSDDINKFLWMVRIGASTPEGAHIKEHDYYNARGEYRMDAQVSDTMKNSVMYKLSYYRFGQLYTSRDQSGYDRARDTVIGHKDIKLENFEECYTSEHWIVRLYKVKPIPNRGE